ncbi:Spore germination protein B3 precursor [compost metagenome]
MLEKVIHVMQSTYHVDVAGFGERLSITHPKYWRKVRDQWDVVFSRTPVTLDVQFTITDYGASQD